jgi:hypothetical protein
MNVNETLQSDLHTIPGKSILCRPSEGGRHFENETESTAYFNVHAAHFKQNTDAPFVGKALLSLCKSQLWSLHCFSKR